MALISLFAGTILMRPEAVSLQPRCNSKAGTMAVTGCGAGMAAVAVDENGNMAIGYSTSGPSAPNFPSIRYAGRLTSDPLNDLGQGEALLFAGSGAQTHPEPDARWGDYSSMNVVDPSDGVTFWATNEYYPVTTDHDWFTRVGTFQFPGGTPTPTPTALHRHHRPQPQLQRLLQRQRLGLPLHRGHALRRRLAPRLCLTVVSSGLAITRESPKNAYFP